MGVKKSSIATDAELADECATCGTELNAAGRCEQCDDEPQPLDFET